MISIGNTGHLPASTFKIPNSIIALETGLIEDDSTLIKWDGDERRLPAWEQDLVFRDAFHYSCVPCYQEIARKIGEKRMLVIEENDTLKLSSKTGWSIRNGNNNGWFVGYLEKSGKVYFIATNIDPEVEFNMDLFPLIRKEISLQAVKMII